METVKSIDTALRHGQANEAQELLGELKIDPRSSVFRFYEALIALLGGDLESARFYIDEARRAGKLEEADEARYLRNVFRLHLRKGQLREAERVLNKLAPYDSVDPGWLLSKRGKIEYETALIMLSRRDRFNTYEKAFDLFKEAETYWNRNGCSNATWRSDNGWWWFKTTYRLHKYTHTPSSNMLEGYRTRRWDVIDNDPSGVHALIARAPWVFFELGIAERV